jgi:autotransporter family porin
VASEEVKRANEPFNKATGQTVDRLFPSSDDPRANNSLGSRIDGDFTGTTNQILRWTACKWGIDEDLVAAQAAVESWWRQSNLGDWGQDPSQCPPDHGPGVDGMAGKCPESYGILQNRYALERAAWPGIERSTAMNADVAYAIWRACYEGYELWLNDVERNGRYSAGDAWGCVGRWFAGRWHTPAAEAYIAKVKDYEQRRVWEQADFKEP